MAKGITICASILLLGLSSPVLAKPADCLAIEHWAAVPAHIRASLQQFIGPVAADGESFNAWDVIDGSQPSNGFVAACRKQKTIAVAVWLGGSRTPNIEVFQYHSGKLVRRWAVPWQPKGKFHLDFVPPPEGANISLQPTSKPLRGFAAAELRR